MGSGGSPGECRGRAPFRRSGDRPRGLRGPDQRGHRLLGAGPPGPGPGISFGAGVAPDVFGKRSPPGLGPQQRPVRPAAVRGLFQPHGALQPKLRLLLPARGGPAQPATTWSPARLMESLEILQDFFKSTLPEGARPQLVFHGAEPLLAKDAVFAGHRKVWRLLPVRGPDQRHPAGPRGQRLPGGPRRGHRAVPGRPHRRGGRPHPAHLGRHRRLRRDRQGPGRSGRLSRAEPHHHGDQGKRPAPAGAGGISPRPGRGQRPAQPGAGHPVGRPEPDAGPGGAGPLFLQGPGPDL